MHQCCIRHLLGVFCWPTPLWLKLGPGAVRPLGETKRRCNPPLAARAVARLDSVYWNFHGFRRSLSRYNAVCIRPCARTRVRYRLPRRGRCITTEQWLDAPHSRHTELKSTPARFHSATRRVGRARLWCSAQHSVRQLYPRMVEAALGVRGFRKASPAQHHCLLSGTGPGTA